MKRKVGDKVTIRKDLKVGRQYQNLTFVQSMKEYLGKTAMIEAIFPNSYSLNDIACLWTDEMFEDEEIKKEYKFKVGDKVKLPKQKSIYPYNLKDAMKFLSFDMRRDDRQFCIIDGINNDIVYIKGWTFLSCDLVPYTKKENIFAKPSICFDYIKIDNTIVHIKLDNETNKPKDCLDNMVRIINGKFKGFIGLLIDVTSICCKPVGIKCNENIYPKKYIADIKIDNNNILHINIDDIENVYKNGTKQIALDDDGRIYELKVKIRNRRTTVTLIDYGITASIYCHEDDEYDYIQGIRLAFKKALAKKYRLEYENAIKD